MGKNLGRFYSLFCNSSSSSRIEVRSSSSSGGSRNPSSLVVAVEIVVDRSRRISKSNEFKSSQDKGDGKDTCMLQLQNAILKRCVLSLERNIVKEEFRYQKEVNSRVSK